MAATAAAFLIGWRQVAASFVLLGAIAMITAAYGVIAVPLAQEFQPSRMVLMLAITVVSAVSGVLAPVLGSLMDRISLRRLMLTGSLLLCAGYAALSFAATFNQVLIVFGVLIAPANVLLGPVAVTVLLSRWFVKRRGTAIGIAIAGISMGGVLFPLLIQFLLESFDWRMALRVFAVILLFVVVPAAALIVNAPADRGLHPDGADSESEESRREATKADVSVMTILTDPAFWMIGLLFAIVLSGMKAVVTNLAPLAIDEGIAASSAALLVSVYAACGFVSKLSFAVVADMLKPRILALIAFAGFAVGMACLSQAASGFWMIVTGACLAGLFGGFMVPLKSLLAPRVFGQGVVGRAMGLLSTLSLCVSLATPPLFGLMFDLTGSYSLICMVFAGLAAGALVLVPYIRMQPRQAALA